MSQLPPLRIGLEPGYDDGRVGAWLLDVPGAFGWARGRDGAISQAPAVAGWWREWLARHGEAWPLGAIGWSEVIEEVPAVVVDDYERNATFAEDARPVEAEGLGAALRRLEFARHDLLALIDRLGAIDAAEGERTADEVLAHLAGVEIWLGSRLDPAARYPGPIDDNDRAAHLTATRQWAAENLRRLHAANPAAARTDSKGETWTLAKVVRRYVYHSVDHLRELDRRLAVTERRVDRLRLSRDRLTDIAPLVRLLRSVGWDRRTVDPERLATAIAETRAMVVAWDGDELVGFGREIGDGVMMATISMVVVDPRWQGLGIASRLMELAMEGRPDVRFSLSAAGGMGNFYRRLGFERDPNAMVRRGG